MFRSLFYSWHSAVVYGVEIREGGVKKTNYLGVSLRVDVSLLCDLRYVNRRSKNVLVAAPSAGTLEAQNLTLKSEQHPKLAPTGGHLFINQTSLVL